jgi:hypothetical protein
MPPANMHAAILGVLARVARAAMAGALALLFVYGLGVASSHRQSCIGHGRGAIECDASVAGPANACVSFGRGLRRCATQPL